MSFNRKWLGRATATVLTVGALLSSAASAETLQEALAAAYEGNPELAAQRAAQRALDERVSQAAANFRPFADSRITATQDFDGVGDFGDAGRVVTGSVDVTQPLYRGGRNRSTLRAADQRVLAGRERLREFENRILLDVVTAYRDVLRDQSEVELTSNNVRVLEQQLQASRDRFEVGDLTRTDVAQSEARLANARSQNIAAMGRLTASREAYRRVVGRAPGTLEPTPPLPTMPGTPEQAIDLAVAESPTLIAARFEEQAARYDVSTARGAILPSADVSAGIGVRDINASGSIVETPSGPISTGGGGREWSQTVGVSATIPLYQSGAAASRIREAQQRRSQALLNIAASERTVIEQARNAFEQVETARATIQAADVAVRANTLALEGVRAESLVGSRTVLDVLDAEQELLAAQVELVRAQRNEYVAGFALLAALGRVEAENLGLSVTPYDPADYYNRVRNKWTGWEKSAPPQPKPTVPGPASIPLQNVSGPQQPAAVPQQEPVPASNPQQSPVTNANR